MTAISFYHLERSSLEQVLPQLLEKTLYLDKRALVLSGSEERVEALNAHLWTYDQDSWLPHGSDKDGDPVDQPIWLSVDEDNLNNAEFLFLTDGAEARSIGQFERCFDIFDGTVEISLLAARERWKRYKDAEYELTYWQQSTVGKWEEK
ncbi:MAG: DNA polymerase III subunit chi [Magnetovibrio sp.]|nr:DNA polymerase III subunit chi [Magnetovibrio sp.]|tara:strand:- start:272 stop:718 length:447 start_codon:yes stop_codon:yes gene_type:complete